MRNNSTIESLKAMRFSAMAAELERQMGDPSAYSQMGFEERLSLLVDAEWNCRQNNKLLRCIREARFATPGAVIEDVEYHEDRHLDKAQILRFASCTMCCFIIVTAASKSAQCFIRNWLFFKTCSMKCVLKMKIQHKIFNNLIIRIIEQFFND